MDLGAYVRIEDVSSIAKANGIEVPRLRGYRLMKDEEPVNISEFVNKKDIAISCVEDLCTSRPFGVQILHGLNLVHGLITLKNSIL